MCLYVDDDGMVTLDSGPRRARKSHRCDECRRTIEPRETYRYWKTLYEGRFDMQRMCAHCWATIEAGAAMTGCPKTWYWEEVFDMTDDSGEFIGDIINHHDLTRRQTALMRLLSHHGKHAWRRRDGSLYPIPEPVEPLVGSQGDRDNG